MDSKPISPPTEPPAKHSPRRPTVGCLFSGMGGLASGFTSTGFAIEWASDVNAAASATFRHRFPKVRFIEKDVRDLSVESDGLKPVDVLAGGFPCQSFSQAGDRKGFDDPRGIGKLFFEIPRLLHELEARYERPRLVVLENVRHLLYGADGEWFDVVRRALRRAGYWFRSDSCWIVNVKDATDIPQDRERLFLVAASRTHFTHNPFQPPSTNSRHVQVKRQHLDDLVDRSSRADDLDYLPRDNRYSRMIAAAMEHGESPQNLYQIRRSYVREKRGGLCPTLTANMGQGGHNVPFLLDPWGIRRLRVTEAAQFQGFSGSETLFPDIAVSEQYRLLGNAVCPALSTLVARSCSTILRTEA